MGRSLTVLGPARLNHAARKRTSMRDPGNFGGWNGPLIHKGRNLGRFRPLRVPPGGRRRYPIAFGVDTLSCLRR
jgi:hypothetical protein